jgi:DNA topoisomerase VI subunit B
VAYQGRWSYAICEVDHKTVVLQAKDSEARTLRSALSGEFSRVSDQTALHICEAAGLNPKANPTRVAHQEAEALYKAIQGTKLMRPPTDCLSPIGEEQIVAGLQKEIQADFYTAVTREPTVYRGNPFQIEVGLAYAKPEDPELKQDTPARVRDQPTPSRPPLDSTALIAASAGSSSPPAATR